MEKEIAILIGALVASLITYVTTKITVANQIKVARINAEKDIDLQNARILDERVRTEIKIEREKLEELHKILSKIALENSQTVSFIQSEDNLDLKTFRNRYLSNCDLLHTAEAIADIYYPAMGKEVREIYSEANIFWGFQEGVLRIDIRKNESAWQANLSKVLEAVDSIRKNVNTLQYQISTRAEKLSKQILDIQRQ